MHKFTQTGRPAKEFKSHKTNAELFDNELLNRISQTDQTNQTDPYGIII